MGNMGAEGGSGPGVETAALPVGAVDTRLAGVVSGTAQKSLNETHLSDPTVRTSAETGVDVQKRRSEARKVAKALIIEKTSDVRNIVEGQDDPRNVDDLNTGERALYEAVVLERGFSHDAYSGGEIKLGSGIRAIAADGRDVVVAALADQRTEKDALGKDKIVYSCVIADPEHPDQKVKTDVPAEALRDGHLGKHAEDIAVTFQDAGQKALVDWYFTGKEAEEVPQTVKEAVIKENDPMNRGNKVLKEQIQKLKDKIEHAGKEDMTEQKKFLGLLELGVEANGQELGAWAKMGVLKKLSEGQQLTEAEQASLADVMSSLEPRAKEAEVHLDTLLSESGMSEGDINKLKSSGLQELVENPGMMEQINKIEDIDQKLFGHSMTEEQMMAIVDKQLSADQKDSLIKKFGKVPKGILIALLIAAGGVAAAVLTTGVGAGPLVLNQLGDAQQGQHR